MQVWKRESINVDAASDMLNNYVRTLSAAVHFIQVKTLIHFCSGGYIYLDLYEMLESVHVKAF